MTGKQRRRQIRLEAAKAAEKAKANTTKKVAKKAPAKTKKSAKSE